MLKLSLPLGMRRPRMGRMPTAVAYSGLSKSRIYDKAKRYRGLIRKNGTASIIDFDVLDQVLDDLPVAAPAE
jgi:hypothetical protein